MFIKRLNVTQARRLVRNVILVEKSESLRGYLREGNSRGCSTDPAHTKRVAVNQDEATTVVDGQKKVQ